MTDLTLDDLAGGGSKAAGEAAQKAAEAADDAGKPFGEFLLDLVDRLEDGGHLEPLLYGPEGMKELQAVDGSGLQENGAEDGGDVELDASTIARIGKGVIDQLGDVRMSKIVRLCEERPELVNGMIEERMEELQ